MVYLDLIVKIYSENIKEIRTSGKNYNWYLIIECSSCHVEHFNEIYFSQSDEHEMNKGHGIANFMMSCKNCTKGMTISLHSKSTFNIQCEEDNSEGVFATFECRGCEIKKWIPKEGIIVEATDSGTLFEDVNVTELWMDYDEDGKKNISLLEPIEYRIERNKNL